MAFTDTWSLHQRYAEIEREEICFNKQKKKVLEKAYTCKCIVYCFTSCSTWNLYMIESVMCWFFTVMLLLVNEFFFPQFTHTRKHEYCTYVHMVLICRFCLQVGSLSVLLLFFSFFICSHCCHCHYHNDVGNVNDTNDNNHETNVSYDYYCRYCYFFLKLPFEYLLITCNTQKIA